VILVGADGERTMLSRRAPLLPLSVAAARWTVVSGYALLEDGVLLVSGDGRRAVLGCSVPAGAERTWWRRVRALRPDVVILNADEAAALEADASALAAAFGGLVVITDADGAVATAADPDTVPRRAMAERVTSVDATGVGDAFAAAFLAELLDRPAWADVDVDRALAAGLELAAQVAGVPAAQAAVPLEAKGASV
jgi:sugar/nucleoside kinase (ribokinase family)